MRTVRQGATPDDALHAIEGYLQRDTPWEEVDNLIDIFEKKGGYEEKGIGTPFEIFTKLLKVTKQSVGETKWKTIRSRYYDARRQRVRKLRDEGLSQRAIAKQVGVDEKQVRRELRTYNKKGPHPRDVIRYMVTSYTNPETAARKLLEKFGAEWCRELAIGVLEELEDQ